jgi:hypothetical protein
MPDRQTKTIVQICRDTNQEEKASGLSKTGWWESICWGVRDCLHREGERREIFKSGRCQTHQDGPALRGCVGGDVVEKTVGSREVVLSGVGLVG